MPSIQRLTNKQLDHLEQRTETRFEYKELAPGPYRRILLRIAKERMRRVGIDVSDLKIARKRRL